MRRLACLLVLATPALARAHDEVVVRLTSPAGPGNVVERGTPAVITWTDPDVGDAGLTLYARPTPPPPYVASWPLDGIEGVSVFGPVPLADATNRATFDTARLAPGHWFVWGGIRASDGHTQYVPPAGVLTLTAPGGTPPPSIWFDSPQRNETAVEGRFEAVYSTWPATGVEVELLGSIDDPEGQRLEKVASGPGGSAQRVQVETRCSGGTGWFTLGGTVRDASGASGSAMATGRVLAQDEAPRGLCPGRDAGDGGGCAAGDGPVSAALALLGVAAGAASARCRLRAKPFAAK